MMIHIQTLEEFNQYFNNNKDKLLVVYFTSMWCGPCRMMALELEALSEEDENKNVVFLRVDIDELPDLAVRYPVRSVPTFLLFKNKEIQAPVVGASPTALRESIEAHRTEILGSAAAVVSSANIHVIKPELCFLKLLCCHHSCLSNVMDLINVKRYRNRCVMVIYISINQEDFVQKVKRI